MEIPLAVRERLRKENHEFRKLEGEHQRLEEELMSLIRHKTLTPQEQVHKKQIQIDKLITKDRIEAMLREHTGHHPA